MTAWLRQAARVVLPAAVAALLAACAGAPKAPDAATPNTTSRPPEPGDPDRRARVRLELASLYFGRGQNDTALAEINTALAAKPDLPEAYALRGLVQASMGDPRLAETSFRRALQLAPADGNTMHIYGWFLCQERRHAEAQAQFEKAMAQPQYRDVVRTLLAQGVCQARDGRWGDAERTLSRSYELDPANPVTAFNLAEVLLRRGELERARFYVRRINALPDQVTSQSLWLAIRIERRLGNIEAMQDQGRQLRERFPQSPETLQFERGRFDE
ncbi:MAG: type IV pilus biogenesis/stability protein PilW [Rubrivivax sp.]|nr:type IV pilus biogenesis/stability protein PilW [Rubrivivax sp.]